MVTAKVSDPDEVASITMKYQVVIPGNYIPSHIALDPATLMARTRP